MLEGNKTFIVFSISFTFSIYAMQIIGDFNNSIKSYVSFSYDSYLTCVTPFDKIIY